MKRWLECKHLYQFTYYFLENFELALLGKRYLFPRKEDLSSSLITPDVFEN